MKKNKLINCPICKSKKTENLLNLNCGNFDNHTLYPAVKIYACSKCGHIFNKLSSVEIEGLMKYYSEEYASANFGSLDKIGDRPGSRNKNTFGRYDQMYDLISKHIDNNCRVLDVGCAMGGFLDYLKLKGLKNLSGIDPIAKYVEKAKEKNIYDIKIGAAESIPFDCKIFNLLVMDQVIEHLVDPIRAFQEAKRVMDDGGLLCLGAPDAMRYNKNYFFDFFWFLMREHIQHFDIEHLKLLAEQEGFELVDFSESDTPMMSEKMILPNLNVIFKLTSKNGNMAIRKNCFKLKNEIKQYIANDLDRLKNKKKVINELVASQRPLYVWGVGREFLYLYEVANLKKCNIAGLFDTNSYKQKTYTIDNRKIMSQETLKQRSPDSAIIISAIAYVQSIKNLLLKIGYKGQIITI